MKLYALAYKAKMNQKEKDLELRARELDRENRKLRGDLELANIDNSALRKQVRGYQAQILEYQYRAGEKQRPNSEITLEDYLDGLNQRKPDVVIKRTGLGGINVIGSTKLSYLNKALIKSIASEYLVNGNVIVRDDITEDQLIDVFIENRVYVPAIVIINKTDLVSKEKLLDHIHKIKKTGWNVIGISALNGSGLHKLRDTIFSELKLIRIYMKPVGKQVDLDEPLILREGDTVDNACEKLHRQFKDKFRYASVTGPSAKHDAQKVGLDHKLNDGDILTIVTSR